MELNINIFDVSAYPLDSTPLTALGLSINCNGIVITDDNSVTFTVTAGENTTLTISKSGYKTYFNTFMVYEIETTTFTVFLEPEVLDSSDPDYIRSYPNFQLMYIPGTYNAQIIDLSSYTASYTYYIDKALASNTRNFIASFLCAGNHEVVQRLTTYNTTLAGNPVWWDVFTWYDSADNNLSTANFYETGVLTTPNTINENDIITLYIAEYKPSNTLSIEVEGNACAGGDCDCIPLGSTITVTPNVVLNLNNQPFPVCTESTLTYELYNYDGGLVDTEEYTIVNADPIDNSTLTYSTTLNIIGDYTLKTILSNCSGTCQIDTVLHLCDFIKITETSCHVYTIQNCSDLVAKDALITVTDLDNNILTGYDNVELEHGTSITLNTPSDGLFVVLIKNADDEELLESLVIIDICNITTCLQTKILELWCDCNCNNTSVDCTDYCKKRYELNAIEAIAFSLFNKINKEYSLNSIYSTIDSSKLSELQSMSSQITKLNSYCGCTNTNDTGLSIFNTTSNSDCGCS